LTEPRPALVIDFGAQYAQLIARRVRECHVYSEIVPFDTPLAELEARRPAGLILSGGPASVYEPGAPAIDAGLFDLGAPVLGICYGQQAMAQALGGRVEPTGLREYGRTTVQLLARGVLLQDLPPEETVWMSHSDTVTDAPPSFRVTARSASTPVAAMEDQRRGLFGVQFHPEVAHTVRGLEILKRFLYDACGLLPEWTPANVIERAVERIRLQIGDGRAICGLSGGVDSAVAALLVHKAIGKNLTCVFVDTGLLRLGEADQVVETFERHFHVPLIRLDREDVFLTKLAGVTDPEAKRKIIGEQFVRTFEAAADDHVPDAGFLVQGTLYPDVIESGSRTAARIKSHHNVGGLPEDMEFELVEPLRDLFKDEARKVGEELGLPEEIVWRQPFPGPGLAVRIVGEVTRPRLEAVRAADRIVQEEVRRADLSAGLWQVFVVLLSIQTVGVMGDGRTYQHPVVIRAVTSEDAMTADWARIPYEVLDRMASRIVAEVPGINRVTYDVTSKPPATIEWE